jgi:hypothetical protein
MYFVAPAAIVISEPKQSSYRSLSLVARLTRQVPREINGCRPGQVIDGQAARTWIVQISILDLNNSHEGRVNIYDALIGSSIDVRPERFSCPRPAPTNDEMLGRAFPSVVGIFAARGQRPELPLPKGLGLTKPSLPFPTPRC